MLTIDGPRACTAAEIKEVIALVDGAMRQGTDQTMLTDYPLVYLEKNLPNIRILKVDGEMASVLPFIPRPVALGECRFTIGIISPTATSPSHRQKGYGARCMHDCIARMNQAGCELSVLWTLTKTFPFYEKGDYQGVRSQGWIYDCCREDASAFAGDAGRVVEYDPASRRHLPDIRAMHERETVGIQRDEAESAALFSLPKMKTLLALRDGAPSAYLVVSHAINKPGLVEGGGEETALEGLVGHALRQLGESETFSACGYLTHSVLGNLLQRKLPGRRRAMETGPMMVRINQARAFFQKIAPWLAKQNGGREREFSLALDHPAETVSLRFARDGVTVGGDRLPVHIELPRGTLSSIIFGPHPERPVETPAAMEGLFPFYFPIWMLDHS